MTPSLVLGPVVRHVDEDTAAVWVQTSDAAEVTVLLEGHDHGWSTRTFAVHGHHYALVEVTGLAAGTDAAYRVEVDGTTVWPLEDEHRVGPPSRLRTLRPGDSLRMAFGSCRTSVPHDAAGHRRHGVDALRTYGIALAQSPTAPAWPEVMLLLGDQIYADETSEAMRDFIASRRSLEEPPGEELKDFAEYAHLYSLAWGEPWLRWLFSCLPTLMIFDDHDVRDDWNTSWAWREHMETLPWWHGRIVAALASYWVYQHLGNLSLDERSRDEIWRVLQERQAETDEEVDLSEVLDDFAARVDQKPQTYRWSFARDVGDCKLVVIDSRAARVLEPGHRTMLDEPEMAWLDEQVRGGHRHLFIGTSLPFLLPAGLHHLEAWNEALAAGGWGRRAARVAEKLRWDIDLEHWAAFQDGFQRVSRMVTEVADGQRGPTPATVTFLSGDVHHSYVAEVEGHREGRSRILQLVCSPIRNPLPRAIRAATALLAHRVARSLGAFVARTANAPEPPWQWNTIEGPWYDNNLAIAEVRGDELEVTWWCGRLVGEDYPQLAQVARFAPAPAVTASSAPTGDR
ncbi:MAG TPA: alkaline phosphatase D family protein [Ornithinimicrobium sp.]|uniref:alkaline phosphatase D family protein n=1 Tax=Ornithinimicrobium sp. TaxID=1977084 RepID=UPI002B48C008|nr:alkaline phosphatase D family protein [Ornithinimicrobium sp.]HKJ12742.1 alkaline phosphatase D family protein [Ornithinimicrobium sp.]